MKQIAVLAGDGIGPEVMEQAQAVLEAVGKQFSREFKFKPALIGGAAWDNCGCHFPDETKAICEESDAILFGSVGGPVSEQMEEKWKNCEANSLLALRKAFQFSANLRPASVYPSLRELCPLKEELIGDGIDILIVRELAGDLYFGEHDTQVVGGERIARDVATYSESQIAFAARKAFEAAKTRSGRVTSVDKANVLDTSKLWREVVSEVASEYPGIELNHMLVDNCAMQLIKAPTQFDVIVSSNMFGDILSDAAAVLPGSLGLMPSASLNPNGFGMYEPSGGSAPEIAGKDVANPVAQILSAAMMLRYSFGHKKEADVIERAVRATLAEGIRTADTFRTGAKQVGTCQFGVEVIARLRE